MIAAVIAFFLVVWFFIWLNSIPFDGNNDAVG